MHASFPLKAYRELVSKAFHEFLLSIRFVTPNTYPNLDRVRNTLSDLKKHNPLIIDPTSTETGLPDQWCLCQFSRSALGYNSDQDEFRQFEVRENSKNTKLFSELRFGYGYLDLNFWLMANMGMTIEACEAFFYRRLYKIRTMNFSYLDLDFHVEIVHNELQSFTQVGYGGDANNESGFSFQWVSRIEVPILMNEVEGFTVQTQVLDVYEETRFPYPITTFPGERSGYQYIPADELDKTSLLGKVILQDDSTIEAL